MQISQSNLSLGSQHELTESSTRIAKFWQEDASLALPEGGGSARSSFGQLIRERLQAVPPELLKCESASGTTATARTSESPFQDLLALLFKLQPTTEPTLPGEVAGTATRAAPLRSLQLMEITQTRESESCTFAASGNVCLADGSSRQFDVGYHMERSAQTTRIGAAEFKDPLVLDFGPPTSSLGTCGVDFDLDCDGKTENVRLPTGDSAVLFYDRNHNGQADDGSELFGATTGNGFGELAKLDGDGNGWIDGGDAAFADLMLWQLAGDGSSSVRSLTKAGVGALATASADTQFTLKENSATVGQMRASSIWLGEESGAGVVRQIDLAIETKT